MASDTANDRTIIKKKKTDRPVRSDTRNDPVG